MNAMSSGFFPAASAPARIWEIAQDPSHIDAILPDPICALESSQLVVVGSGSDSFFSTTV